MAKIDIISDPICPWCYIGKTRLDRALELNPTHNFIIEWHPFQLNPTMPKDGMDRREYLEAKFGGQKEAIEVYSNIDKTATETGLSLNFGGIKRTPNTIDAHRLIHWAGIEGRQNSIIDRLFKAYFQEGRDISEHSVLTRIASAAGMDQDVVRSLLKSDADKEDIKARDTDARKRGIQGVPAFVVANEYVIQGAQTIDIWDNIIKEIQEVISKNG
ncbi:DsbA family oxidoreductase [Amylibacter sp.]|jgi:predicted DsbA family dithiol-disulfide isomerase|nr:DsbA family oxidoreductase [Amylibacter sp.]MDA9074705.1 DsbA family oxidoreductase [Amylibacter sp.]MDB4249121.1 DsbA family oxidoreductase [Amylibacter sp.]MDB9803952.1 DsbA family oxidoreductase [Amylibacter sp.]MDB9919214.1 DsbA family oxidoreductase [Amylibacter sp.]|tara:strand:+ start:291 stop:935 length:645 start_codon:yes stop_codon:yes gene_type:complete